MLCLLAFLLGAPALLAQLSRSGVVRGFKLPEFYDPVPGKVPPNRLKYLITGAEAQPESKDLVIVKQMRLESYQVDGKTNLVAIAPHSWVDLDQHQISSTGRLDMVTGDGQLALTGDGGFFCRLTNFTMVVSNHVRTVIHHASLKELKK